MADLWKAIAVVLGAAVLALAVDGAAVLGAWHIPFSAGLLVLAGFAVLQGAKR